MATFHSTVEHTLESFPPSFPLIPSQISFFSPSNVYCPSSRGTAPPKIFPFPLSLIPRFLCRPLPPVLNQALKSLQVFFFFPPLCLCHFRTVKVDETRGIRIHPSNNNPLLLFPCGSGPTLLAFLGFICIFVFPFVSFDELFTAE